MEILLGHHPALEGPQHAQAHQGQDRQGDDEMHPDRRVDVELEDHETDHADDAHRRHDEEGRAVRRVGEAVVQAAVGAFLADGQIALEQRADAAARAAAAHAGLQRAEGRIDGVGHSNT
ncbi:hypothetical protein D3C80_1478980 [compost metagenome]